jgi:hypothetical protein
MFGCKSTILMASLADDHAIQPYNDIISEFFVVCEITTEMLCGGVLFIKKTYYQFSIPILAPTRTRHKNGPFVLTRQTLSVLPPHPITMSYSPQRDPKYSIINMHGQCQ